MSTLVHQAPVAAKPTPACAPKNLLQRQCACSEQDDLLKRGVQAKLTVNRPGDRWELEADRAADSVMGGWKTSSAPASAPALMRSMGSGPVTGEAPAGVRAALRSPGRPLESGTRSFMEERFGFDFSRVHIHDDPLAARSAHELNALAYTVGTELVFAPGQYAPGTDSGRRLLAHELAHTVQQDSASQVRRETASLAVKGLYEGRGDATEANFVYFDLDSPTPADTPPESVLDTDERAKIEKIAKAALAANDQDISLYGFASEEGVAATNNPLIQRRLAAVQNVLQQAGFAGGQGGAAQSSGPASSSGATQSPGATQSGGSTPTAGSSQTSGSSSTAAQAIHLNSRLSCSKDKYDYRFWRAVEIQRGTAAQTRPCTDSPAAPVCSTERMKELAPVQTSSLKLLEGPDGVIPRLDVYLKNPADEPKVAASLDRLFKDHSPKTAQAVKDRMVAIRDFISDMGKPGKAVVKCGTDETPICNAGATAAADSTEVTLCKSFFDDPAQASDREATLIHEASHGSKIPSDDRAYNWERAYPILSTKQALANADSLSGFVMDMHGRKVQMEPDHKDEVTGCDPAGGNKNKTLVQEAIAWAQRWNMYASTGTAETYDNLQNRAAMSPYHMAHFGRDDKAAIAGLYDKYAAMDGWFSLFYNISCAQPGDAACSGSRKVQWNLTRAATPASGGPVPEPKSGTSSTTPGSAAGSTPGATTTTPAPVTGTTTQSQPTGSSSGASTTTAAPTGTAPQAATPAPAVAAGDITVCPDFFNLGTLYDRVVEMHSGLAVHLPGVTEATSRSYARLAFNYKINFWKVPD